MQFRNKAWWTYVTRTRRNWKKNIRTSLLVVRTFVTEALHTVGGWEDISVGVGLVGQPVGRWISVAQSQYVYFKVILRPDRSPLIACRCLVIRDVYSKQAETVLLFLFRKSNTKFRLYNVIYYMNYVKLFFDQIN